MKHQLRSAFTLVELLVVMGIILMLATFAVVFFPSAASSAREARGGQTLQGFLLTAKQRAMRDQAPRGVRLWIRNPDFNVAGTTAVYQLPTWAAGTNYVLLDGVVNNGIAYRCVAAHTATVANAPAGAGNAQWRQIQLVTDCQYIEQPEDFAGTLTTTMTNQAMAPFMNWNPVAPPAQYPMLTNVLHNGSYYYARQTAAAGVNPATSPAVWVKDQMIVSISADLTNGHGVVKNPLAFNPPINPTNPPFTAAQAESNITYWVVQPGDYLEVNGTGLMHRIVAVFPSNVGQLPPFVYQANTPPTRISVAPALPFGLPLTANYRILRRPRVVGDETLKMPSDTFIDLDTNLVFNNPLPSATSAQDAAIQGTGFVDIVFGPNGGVISRGLTTANIHLWVRTAVQEQPSNPFRGDPTLVSVFTKTGLVGAYSPNPNIPPGPYDLVK